MAFLCARLDEDEADAQKHLNRFVDGEWRRVICDPLLGGYGGQSPHRDLTVGLYIGRMSEPARVLREVEAKRAILRWHPSERMRYIDASRCPQCELTWPCPTVRLIAAVYSDHPDYRDEWKP